MMNYIADPIGFAMLDHYNRVPKSKLWIHNEYGPKEEMPVSIYFRNFEDMPAIEQQAMSLCKGKILDIGAGAGSHTLWLQDEHSATAIEISPNACKVMALRGVKHIIEADIMQYQDSKYDTLLLLMNGIGLTANISGLRKFLQHAKKLLTKNGQLLFDSSDVSYLYKGVVEKPVHYYGEIRCRYEYKKEKSSWFSWLYVDRRMLKTIADEEGWSLELITEDEDEQYLVRLKPI